MPFRTTAQHSRGKAQGAPHELFSRPWWPWAKRALTAAFFALVLGLLFTQARAIDWAEVGKAIRAYSAATLVAAAGLAAASYAVYSTFDLIAQAQTRHALSRPRVVMVAFISYAFNLNLGALIGGAAFRYRLYSRFGLDGATVTQIYGLSVLTNWLGYLLLGGLAFCFWPPALAADWRVHDLGLRAIGIVLLLAVLAYLSACALATRRTWHLFRVALRLPSLRLALAQLVLSSINWLLIASVLDVLLQGKIAFARVLSALLLAAIAGVIVHIPAGLGVLEAVFLALLGTQMRQGELLAALLAYRAIYYLAPLALALVLYTVTELRARKHRSA
ncbi:MAG TPA: lysylphosphatidylglycerol synthase domain-containing protein [Burkholderiales bacterium]|nr:lysylphosphatidylglycerol synthase domain-containing protein [Burkholderiales bacterium]